MTNPCFLCDIRVLYRYRTSSHPGQLFAPSNKLESQYSWEIGHSQPRSSPPKLPQIWSKQDYPICYTVCQNIYLKKKTRNQEKKIDQSINVNILIIERKYAAFHRVKIKWDLFSYPVWMYSNSIFLPIRTNVSGRRRAVNEILLVLKPTGNKGGFLFFLLINSNIFLAAIVSTYPTNFFSCRCS